jgi:two-component system, cell cycle sensor histidine kinase and response regulator CckA
MEQVVKTPDDATKDMATTCPSYKPGAEGFGEQEDELIRAPASQLTVAYENASSTTTPNAAPSALDQETRRQKEAERIIRLQAAALQSAANAILITDNKGTITWANPAFTALTGYTLEEALGQNTRILKSGEHDASFYETLWKTVLSGNVWRGELVNLRKDGTRYFEEQTITPVLNEAGEAVNFIAIKQDVTARKRAEQEMARLNTEIQGHRDRLNNILANVPGVVWEAWGQPDAATQQIEFVNDYVETMLGYSVEEWLSTPNFWLSIVHPDDKEGTARDAAEHFGSAKSTAKQEFRWVAKDGRVLWVEANFAVITDDKGQPVGLRGVTTDISERKRMGEALRETYETLQSLIQTSPLAIIAHDLQGRVKAWNPAAERIFGWSEQEVIGRKNPAIPVNGWVEYEDAIDVLRHGGTLNNIERKRLTKDGSLIDASISVAPLRDPQGAICGTVAVIADITQQKMLEEEFRQSQKMEAVGRLAGGLAHDFNNLLTAITGYSELAIRSLKPGDPLLEDLEEIKKAGNSAAALTRQLLAFSRRQLLQPKVFHLNSVVSELEKMLKRLIGEDIKLSTVLDPELGNVKADAGQIEQVIMNLAVNARDAMPKGGKLIIETANVDLDGEYTGHHLSVTPGPYVMLAVTDTGSGMDPKTQERIFDPFFTTKELGKGSGLGLSMVYGIVKQSHGNIWVYSEVGRGTTFKIYLPRVSEGEPEYKRSREPEKTLRGSETVLLAEDEERVRKLARKALESYGYQVLEAANGGAALLICERHQGPIHQLLTDVVMPEMSGHELVDRLAQLRPDMKVLYMSGYIDNFTMSQRGLDEHANFIQKPFSPDALARKVREVLDGT